MIRRALIGVLVAVLVMPGPFGSAQESPDPLCVGDGQSGPRVVALYATQEGDGRTEESARAPNSETVEDIRSAIRVMDRWINDSFPEWTQRVRWECTDGQIEIVPTWADVSETCGPTYWSNVDPRITASDRLAVIFADGCGGSGGGALENDSSKSQENRSNDGRRRVTWIGYHPDLSVGRFHYVLTHELFHSFGAVQLDAPNSSGASHGYVTYDLMSYNDGGPYFQNGGQLDQRCPDRPEYGNGYGYVDCLGVNYYNPDPEPGSYLDTHFNIATDSVWLTPPEPAGATPPEPSPSPTPTPTPSPTESPCSVAYRFEWHKGHTKGPLSLEQVIRQAERAIRNWGAPGKTYHIHVVTEGC